MNATPTLKPFFCPGITEAGVDEAGRGCLAGPVFAAAVILPPSFSHPFLNDSKKLSRKQREALRPVIEEQALAWAVGRAEVEEIDRINILQASFLAMHRAITGLSLPPELLLIDGNRFRPYPGIAHHTIIGGDGLYLSIAAASVLAKTRRDEYMDGLHPIYPQYGWNRNMGYGTKAHRDAIVLSGPCDHHRKSFALLPQPELFPQSDFR